ISYGDWSSDVCSSDLDVGFGDEKETAESDENQLDGSRPATRYTVVVGRFTLTDFFDNNRYTHDPRTQFIAWANMYNGAWDYPAEDRKSVVSGKRIEAS